MGFCESIKRKIKKEAPHRFYISDKENLEGELSNVLEDMIKKHMSEVCVVVGDFSFTLHGDDVFLVDEFVGRERAVAFAMRECELAQMSKKEKRPTSPVVIGKPKKSQAALVV